MAQPDQGARPNQPNSSAPKTVKIRMKPGHGKALLGRKYKLTDGSITSVRPKTRDEILDTLDDYLEQGQERDVPIELLEGLLDKNGKPSRVIEGYPMVVMKGDVKDHDDDGNPLPKRIVTEDTLTAGRLYYKGTELIASHPDCPFEIVQDSRAA
jgi:hypothetical protein